MRIIEIRSRMLLAALLPVTLIAIVLACVFLWARFGDMDEAHGQRTRSLARQIATASEFGLFSANVAHLQTIANGVMREPDVQSITILDEQGHVFAMAGKPGFKTPPSWTWQEGERFDSATGVDLLSQPISASQVKLDDLFEPRTEGAVLAPKLLGRVLIEFSHAALIRRESEMLLAGISITLAGLLFGWFLAVRLGRGVIRPILQVSGMIERVGRGELSTRLDVLPNDPLRDVQLGLNQMAENLQKGRDELDQRIVVATQALREKKEEAETATLAKSRFLAAASHDLRQPTHALGMFVTRLAQLPHDTEIRHLIDNLEASVRALQDLLDGLLDISRLESNTVRVDLRPFALADIFEPLRAGLSMSAAEKGLHLRIRPTQAWVMSDITLLNRIMLNLVGNALRYTRVGGVLVACRTSADGALARIEVWDTGIGIAPEHHQAIFREFFQVGNLERDRQKGLGLGLHIVERTSRLLGYRLQMRSTPGRGTVFSLQLPMAPASAVKEVKAAPEINSSVDLAGLVMLVIEDDALAREGMMSLLESWGAVVYGAEGLSGALVHLKQGCHPRVLISDYRLRDGEDGMTTIRRLRVAAGYAIPACLMSGDTDPALLQAARLADLPLLHKPVRPAKLRSLIRRLAASGSEVNHLGEVVRA